MTLVRTQKKSNEVFFSIDTWSICDCILLRLRFYAFGSDRNQCLPQLMEYTNELRICKVVRCMIGMAHYEVCLCGTAHSDMLETNA